MMTNIHQNYSPDWRTPPEWVEWARTVMGGIDLDPCASSMRLETFAEKNYGKYADGLIHKWGGKVYVNPPGANSVKSVKVWWAKFIAERPNVDQLVWCFFNNEAVRSLKPSPWNLPGWMVMPEKRVAFMRGNKQIKSPRNWTWFWVYDTPRNCVVEPPIPSIIIPTGA